MLEVSLLVPTLEASMLKQNDDRSSWNRAWASMPHRRLPAPTRIDLEVSLVASFGDAISASISQDPPQYSNSNWRKSENSPVCGATADATKRLAATLHPTFANGFTCGVGVWVHESCFSNCPHAEEPDPLVSRLTPACSGAREAVFAMIRRLRRAPAYARR